MLAGREGPGLKGAIEVDVRLEPVAQVIVEGIMEGQRGEDLRALTDLDPTAYQSKRRLIRRRIAKLIRKPKP